MNIKFIAEDVSYNEALGADIVQIGFYEYCDDEVDYSKRNAPLPPPIKGITISANYEFPPYDLEVEWCDEEGYDGGCKIKELDLTEKSIRVVLDNQIGFDIEFNTDKVTYKNIRDFLLKQG